MEGLKSVACCAGSVSPIQYSIALSCNHPLYVLWYVQEALPDLLALTDVDWAAEYQPAALKAYLVHHRALLIESGLWEQAAAVFVQKY